MTKSNRISMRNAIKHAIAIKMNDSPIELSIGFRLHHVLYEFMTVVGQVERILTHMVFIGNIIKYGLIVTPITCQLSN